MRTLSIVEVEQVSGACKSTSTVTHPNCTNKPVGPTCKPPERPSYQPSVNININININICI